MKLYTKEEGLVADINNKLYERLRNQYNFFIVINEENLLTEKEYQEHQTSKRKKLDIDYPSINYITVDVSWSYEINGAGVSVSCYDKLSKLIYNSCLISDDEENNDFHERITESCGGSCILLEDVLTYLDKEQLDKYNIKIHDVNDDNKIVYNLKHQFNTQENSDT